MRTVHEVHDEPTLSESLHFVAYTRLPTQFYQLLQIAIPLAFQFWAYGLHRTAGWMAVVSMYGLWALSVKRLEGTDPADARFAWTRIGRAVTRGVGGALAAILAVEGVVRFLSIVFQCPGCAG